MKTLGDLRLAEQPLLQSLPAALLKQLEMQQVIELPGVTEVFATHGQCSGFPIILSGSVRVFRHLANGRRIELYRVTTSEPCILSLGCLLGGGQYPASGITSGNTQLVVMPAPLFNICLAEHEGFRTAIFRALGERLVNTMELVEEVATLRLDVRLAAALLTHAAQSVSAGQDAVATGGATIAITHQSLADELGTVREMISRVLDEFAQMGLVQPGRGQIQIVDAGRLRRLADTR